MGNDHLTVDELTFIPTHSYFVFPVGVEIVNDVDVVVQVYSTVLHQNVNAGNVGAVEESPSLAERLAENLLRQFHRLDGDAAVQIQFAFPDPLPVDAGEVLFFDVRVQVNAIGFLSQVRRAQTDVVDETEFGDVESNVMDDVGDNQTSVESPARLVVEPVKEKACGFRDYRCSNQLRAQDNKGAVYHKHTSASILSHLYSVSYKVECSYLSTVTHIHTNSK
jgi:hypothetical protein